MEVNKNAAHFDPAPAYPADDAIDTPMPPPYSDEPPAYSAVFGSSSSTMYSYAPTGLDSMSKLPYGDLSNNSSQLPRQPLEMQNYYQETVSPQMTIRQFSYQETFSPQPSNAAGTTPQSSQPDIVGYSSNSSWSNQRPSNSIAPHKDLLRPAPSRIVETKTSRHGKTKSHVTDLQTGKEYFIKEKVSRRGQCSKTVVVEVGGPKTIVKETPKRTTVSQKKK